MTYTYADMVLHMKMGDGGQTHAPALWPAKKARRPHLSPLRPAMTAGSGMLELRVLVCCAAEADVALLLTPPPWPLPPADTLVGQ